METAQITAQAQQAATELLEAAHLETGDLFVVGCSSSEALGGLIGHDSSPEAGAAIARAALDSARAHGCDLAAQCCEHLNRALVMEREAACRRGYQQVWAVPQPKAGGSFATGVWALMSDPVLVDWT